MEWYDYLLEYGPMILAVVVAIIMWIRTKNVKYLKEVVNVANQKIDSDGVVTEVSSSAPRVGKYAQSFEGAELVPVYRLNTVTGELEATGEYKNLDEYIQSFKDIALQAALERFVPSDSKVEQELQEELDEYSDWLDEYGAVLDRANQFAEDENLDENASLADVFAAMRTKADWLKGYIADFRANKKDKGGEDNAPEKVSADEKETS